MGPRHFFYGGSNGNYPLLFGIVWEVSEFIKRLISFAIGPLLHAFYDKYQRAVKTTHFPRPCPRIKAITNDSPYRHHF